jgi:N-acetylmuramoyl-L-alanine amidase
MGQYHVVQQGECLARIAKKYGFSSYRTIYDDSANQEFRKKRPDPNLVYPGDQIFIPDKQPKVISVATGAQHTFTVQRPVRTLRLKFQDSDGRPLASTPYTLIVGNDTYLGETDGDGVLVETVVIDAETGTLKLNGMVWEVSIAHLNPLEETPDEGISGIQGRLRNLGYNPGAIDGVLGPRTTRAIREFQEDNPPLEVDGVCGPKTRAELLKKHGC